MINGWHFHDDKDKAAELEAMVPEFRMLAEQVVYGYIMDCAHVATKAAHIVRAALESGDLR